jgi:alpha-L-fucosidase
MHNQISHSIVSRIKCRWFADAKLGIFIHWGIYAVNGISESWSFHNKEISYPNYMQQFKGFTAEKYDPNAWAELDKKIWSQICRAHYQTP